MAISKNICSRRPRSKKGQLLFKLETMPREEAAAAAKITAAQAEARSFTTLRAQ
jgi:hypothetical protein